MLFSEPPRSQVDVDFSIFGFPVRVSVWFWVVMAALGWEHTLIGQTSADRIKLMLSWILAAFLSILIHELGHAFMSRRFGMTSRIVLHHAGGVAISSGTRNPREQIAISLAGPFAQLAAAFVLMLFIAVSGAQIPVPGFVANLLFLPIDQPPIQNEMARWFAIDFLLVSIFWAVFNLFPIHPLDGGQISRQLFIMFDRSTPIRNSLILSIITCAILALLNRGSLMMMMFIYFGILNYLEMQGGMPGRGGYGGGGFRGGYGGRGRGW